MWGPGTVYPPQHCHTHCKDTANSGGAGEMDKVGVTARIYLELHTCPSPTNCNSSSQKSLCVFSPIKTPLCDVTIGSHLLELLLASGQTMISESLMSVLGAHISGNDCSPTWLYGYEWSISMVTTKQFSINNKPDDILPRKLKKQELFSRCLRNEGLFAIVF